MKPRLALPALLLIASMSLPLGASAATSACPRDMLLTPVIFVPEGAKKDRNGNGFVCIKDVNGDAKGGPDDKSSDIADDIVV